MVVEKSEWQWGAAAVVLVLASLAAVLSALASIQLGGHRHCRARPSSRTAISRGGGRVGRW